MKRTSLLLSLVLVSSVSAQETVVSGGAFSAEAVDRMKDLFIANASGGDMDCITTLNAGLRRLYDRNPWRLGSQIDRTYAILQREGLSSGRRDVDFEDENGRRTRGVTAPVALRENVFDLLVAQSRGQTGFFVYGLSLMDGYHSITLTLDATDPDDPHVYWSDQWSSHGGWFEYSREELNAKIEELTNRWWTGKFNSTGQQFRCRTTLWQAWPTEEVAAEQPEPEVEEASGTARLREGTRGLRLRSEPGFGDNVVGVARPGQEYEVVSRTGEWIGLRGPNGEVVYASEEYLEVRETTGISGRLPGQ